MDSYGSNKQPRVEKILEFNLTKELGEKHDFT
jgi:hypothetical protein